LGGAAKSVSESAAVINDVLSNQNVKAVGDCAQQDQSSRISTSMKPPDVAAFTAEQSPEVWPRKGHS
jgi:hypothetical protein